MNISGFRPAMRRLTRIAKRDNQSMDWEARGKSSADRELTPVLCVNGLSVSYSVRGSLSRSAIVNVSFDLYAGEILGVVGESGSGKSTLAASLLNLLPPGGRIHSGGIVFGGRNILGANPAELRILRAQNIALINQEPSLALHPTMRVRDQVDEVLAAHAYGSKKTRHERVREVLSYVFSGEAERIASCYPHQLSGGQRQRVLIAMALACGPSIIIADEATASLDYTAQRKILSLFGELRRKFNTAVILITHNPALLAGFADRLLVLYAGRVVELGPAEAVLHAPLHPYTRALLQCLPPSVPPSRSPRKTKLRRIAGESPGMGSFLPGCQFEPRCSERLEACRRQGPVPVLTNLNHCVFCLKYCP
jgi:oligopeptide/dipeptide ABC transporter ATP-binding protein